MKKELQEKIYKRCPLLYAQKDDDPRNTCMCWGISVGDGWYNLLYALSASLERMIEKQPEGERASAGQVKEKFGGLRFYLDGPCTDAMHSVVSMAESLSMVTCEKCGSPGQPRGGGWIKTLCDKCAE